MMDRDVPPCDIFMHGRRYRPGHISKRIYVGWLLKESRAWEADGKTRYRGMCKCRSSRAIYDNGSSSHALRILGP